MVLPTWRNAASGRLCVGSDKLKLRSLRDATFRFDRQQLRMESDRTRNVRPVVGLSANGARRPELLLSGRFEFPDGLWAGRPPKKRRPNFAGSTVPRPVIATWLHCMFFGLRGQSACSRVNGDLTSRDSTEFVEVPTTKAGSAAEPPDLTLHPKSVKRDGSDAVRSQFVGDVGNHPVGRCLRYSVCDVARIFLTRPV
jgi:hypothetical protein